MASRIVRIMIDWKHSLGGANAVELATRHPAAAGLVTAH